MSVSWSAALASAALVLGVATSAAEAGSGPAGPTPAAATTGPAGLLGVADRKVVGASGDWAEYAQLANGKAVLESTFRLVVLDDPATAERWMELWMDKTGYAATRFRFARTDGKTVPSVFLKIGPVVYLMEEGQLAETLSCGGPGACNPHNESAPRESFGGRLFPVTVTAGKFQAVKMRKNGAEIWYSDGVPVLRLAKALFPDGRGYELVAIGHDLSSTFPKGFKAKPFPAARWEALTKALIPSPQPLVPAAPACDPATSSCAPTPVSPPPVLKEYVPPEKRPGAP